jgi:hypothetical protein
MLAIGGIARGEGPTDGPDLFGRRADRVPDSSTIPSAVSGLSGAAGEGPETPQHPRFTTIQYDGMTYQVPAVDESADHQTVVRKRHQAIGRRRAGRPRYVDLVAGMSNFDADAQPDGWRAELTLLDSHDRPVVRDAYARFELMPRFSVVDHVRFADAAELPMRWSMRLEFDEDAVARVRLPLRSTLRPVLGWPNDRHRNRASRHPETVMRRPAGRDRFSGPSAIAAWRQQLGKPSVGQLSVRVSVPAEGVFGAIAVVPVRPSVLVDTPWPYR